MSTALGLELAGLLARVESATAADRELDWAIWAALQGVMLNTTGEYRGALQHPDWVIGDWYGTSSLDASLGLCERVLPGWERHVRIMSNTDALGGVVEPGAWERKGDDFRGLFTTNHQSPALALLAAMLRALIAQGEARPAEPLSRSGSAS